MIHPFFIGCLLAVIAIGTADAGEKQQQPLFNAADAFYDAAAMRAARKDLLRSHGDKTSVMFSADRFEWLSGDSEDALLWDMEAWYGGDINKLVVESSGVASLDGHGVEDADIQILWSRAVSPFFDFRAGLRHDFRPVALNHLAIGVVGLAPYWLEMEASVFLSEDGDLTADVDVEYEWLFSQRFALLSRTEIEAAAQAVPALSVGSGLNEISQSLRLRYALTRKAIPYVGAEWSRAFAGHANLLRAAGEETTESKLVLGINFWF